MPDYCPSCGSKVEKEHKFCLGCGSRLQHEDSNYLDNSMKHEILVSPPQKSNVKESQSSVLQLKKTKKIFFMALISIIAVVIVIVVVIFIFLGGSADSRFVGEWDVTSGDYPLGSMIFEGNGDWKIGYIGTSLKVGTWSVEGDNFCWEITDWLPEIGQTPGEIQCYQYEFSDNGNTLVLTATGVDILVLTKS